MMSTHKTSSTKTYLFESIAVKEGPHQSPKHLYDHEASVMFESKNMYINKSKWCIKGKDIEKMDLQGSNELVISTTKGKTYDFRQFLGDDTSWQEFQKKLDRVYSRKTDTPKADSFSNFIKGSSRLGLGSPRRQRLAPTKVVTDKKTSPRRPHAVFGRGTRQRPLIASVPWDNEETTRVHDTESEDTLLDVSPPPSPVKRPTASPKKRPVEKRPVDLSDDESQAEKEPVRRAFIRKRRLVIDDESEDDEEEFGQDLPMTTPQANRVVSPRLTTRSVSPQRPTDELDKNQTTLSGFFAKKNVENKQMSMVKRELELTPRKSSVNLVSTPTRLGKSSTGSSRKRSLQQKGWLSPGNDASRGRKMERFGILSAGVHDDESEFKAKEQAKSRSYNTSYGSSSASFVFNKEADRERFEKYDDGQGTPKIPVAFSSPNQSPVRSRLSLKRVSRSPVSKHAINDLTKSQAEPALRYNQYSGLRNLGNTCYMNSCLQMICTLPDLIKSLHNRGGALTKSLTGVAEKLQKDPVRAVDPHAVKEAMDAKTDKFLGYEQRDAHEFLSDLIDSIHEEVQSEKSKPSEAPQAQTSPMDDFLLTVRVCLTCASCGYSRSKEETYRHLSVDIISNKEGDIDTKATVEKGLGKFFEEEIREIKCEKCEDGTHATQTMQMVQRPKSLVLHLKRFIFVEVPIASSTSNDENESPNSSSKPVQMQYVFQKNKEQVQLSESLSLDPFFMKFPDDEATRLTEPKNEYKLQSIVHHIGARASSGHYTADAVRPARGMAGDSSEEVKDGTETAKPSSTTRDDDEKQSWVTFDDTTSYITSLDKILSNPSKERTAYMLLYSLDES